MIMGLMGVGKSTTGRAVAAELDRPYLDSDNDIEVLVGESGSAFVEAEGVEALHRLEAAVLIGALAGHVPSVITAAASTVEDDLVRRIVPARAVVVRLDAPLDLILRRQATGGHRRPMNGAELKVLATRREPLFAEIESLRVDASLPTPVLLASIVDFVRRHESARSR